MDLTVSILYSLFVFFLLTTMYFFLGYRSSRKEWSQQIKQWYPEEKGKVLLVSGVTDLINENRPIN
ncbi:hypothetical protein [Ornithinibacillus scapharcae]|uniref:hypothetical protein n=1 Tax=Ornithinibacillus scapharcae TaxID=1147159 RepID=UPI00110FBD1C|nr:hypothetical protein [Ornithinibacillus scapharcae]